MQKKKKKKVGRRAGQITEFQTADNQSLPHGEQNTYADVYSMKKKITVMKYSFEK